MESANSHHQLKDQLVGSSSSPCSLISPSCFEIGTTTHAWTPTSILNTNGFITYPSESILNSRETRHQENTLLSSQYSSSTDLGYYWANTTENLATNQSAQVSSIKEELADHYYRNYMEILRSNSPSTTSGELSLRNNEQTNDLGTKLLLKSLSSGNLMNKIQLSPGHHLYSNNGAANIGRGFTQIFPSVNVSNLNQTGFTNQGSLDMNLEALDLLASSRFSGNFSTSSQDQIGLLRDELSYGFDHMHQSHQIPFYPSSKVSASSNGLVETKRSSSRMAEPKAPIQKKSRLEARASCPPFKVRKEKLGDRIAALQQLVAPFGKTDTASVLMEAIGYINFLQSQVETLSVPYMKASRTKYNRVMKGTENENEEHTRDLKSRGLCLVPLSCLSYITDGDAGAVWPPPHFGGAT